MSDPASIVKEFLVKLGVAVDNNAIKKFGDGVEKATKTAAKLATGIEAMAVAVAAAVTKVSEQFEDLYYASQRIGSSVEDIRGFSFAIGQMGGDAKGAKQSLENLAEFLRSNPGAPRFLEGLGVHLKYVNGQAQIGNAEMGEFGAKLRAMPYYQAKIIAGMMGIDTATLQALLRGPDEAEKRYHKLAQSMGVDQDKAAKASHEFMNDVRELLALVTLAAEKVVLAIQPMADKVVKWLEDLNDATGGWSTGLIALAAVLAPIIALVDPLVVGVAALAAGMAALWDDFQKWRGGGDSLVDWSEWSDQIDAVTAALGPLEEALGRIGGDLVRLAQEVWREYAPAIKDVGHLILTVLVAALHLVTDSINVISDLLEHRWSKAWADARKTASDAVDGIVGALKAGTKAVEDFFYPMLHHGAAPPQAPVAPTGPSAQAHAANQPVHLTGQVVAPYIRDFFQRHGLNSAQAAGVTAGVGAESKFDADAVNPTSGAFGIGQWLGARKAELFKRYGPHPSLDQQLEFMLWELMGGDRGGAAVRGAGSASATLDAYIRKFMRPGKGTAGDLSRGSAYLTSQLGNAQLGSQPAAVNVNQKTDIHVHGVSDPNHAGREVASAQDRVNGQLVRNLKTAVS